MSANNVIRKRVKQLKKCVCYPSNFVVQYHSNDPNVQGEPPPTITYARGTTVSVQSSSLTFDGYVFTGWNTKPDGSGTNFVVNSTFAINSDVYLYAQWSHSGFLVLYDTNTLEATGGQYDFRLYQDGDTVTVLDSGSIVYSNDGYEFMNWAHFEYETNYNPGDTFIIHGNVTLHAMYMPKFLVIPSDPIPLFSG